jgi:hypothetical protein
MNLRIPTPMVLLFAAILAAGCSGARSGTEANLLNIDLKRLEEQVDTVNEKARNYLDAGIPSPSEVERISEEYFTTIMSFHDGLARADLELILKSEKGLWVYEKHLLKYESTIKDFDLFLTSVKVKAGVAVEEEEWFAILTAQLAEAYDKLLQDRMELGKRLRLAGGLEGPGSASKGSPGDHD